MRIDGARLLEQRDRLCPPPEAKRAEAAQIEEPPPPFLAHDFVLHAFRRAQPPLHLRHVRGGAVLHQHLGHADQAEEAAFRKREHGPDPLQQFRVGGQHRVAEMLAVQKEQLGASEPFPGVGRPTLQERCEIPVRCLMEPQLQGAGGSLPGDFLHEAVAPDAEAVGKDVLAHGVEHRAVGLGHEPAQDGLPLPLRQLPREQPVAVHQSLRADERHVRPAALDEAEVAERADLRVAEDEQHRVRGQQVEHRIRVPRRKIAAGTVVRIPAGRRGIRDHARARQRRGPGPQPRSGARHGCPTVQKSLCADRQPDRGEAVTHQRIRAEDRHVVGVEVEPEQGDQQDAVALEDQEGSPAARHPRGPPAAEQRPQAERGQRAARGRQLPQHLCAEPSEKREPVSPSRAGAHVHAGVAAAADVVPERPPIVD